MAVTIPEWTAMIVSAGGVVYAGVKLWGEKFVEGKVNLQFQKKIAEHQNKLNEGLEAFKAELNRVAQNAEFDYRRKLHTFQAQSDRRRAAYESIFAVAQKLAYGVQKEYEVKLQELMTSDDIDAEELISALSRESYGESYDTELIGAIDKGAPIDILKVYTQILWTSARETADPLFQELESVFETNGLYLSKSVEDATRNFLMRYIELEGKALAGSYDRQANSIIVSLEVLRLSMTREL